MKIYKLRFYAIGLISLLISLNSLSGQERFIVFDSTYLPAIEKVRKAIPGYMSERNIPGLSITIAKDGKMLWSEGFGVQNTETNREVTVNSMFRVGSLFKTVTALGILKLVHQGKLNLDDKVVDLLPDLPQHYKKVTVRNLANHTAGVRHYKQVDQFYAGIRQYGSMMASLENNPEFRAEILSNKPYNSVKESLHPFIDDKLLFNPGSKFRYSTYGYVVLGAIIERVSGKSFNEFIRQEVLIPLDMNHTKPDRNDDLDPNKVSPYINSNGPQPAPPVDLSNKWSGGGYVSNSLDFVKMANGFRDLITDQLFQEMTSSVSLSRGGVSEYGIGWKLAEESSGGKALYHDGFTPGGGAVLIIFSNLTVCIATNQTTIVSAQDAANVAIPFFELK